MDLNSLADKWISEGELLRTYGDERGAAVCALHASELRRVAQQYGDELMTLAEASLASGYAERSLRLMIAQGTLANAGRKGAPRIRRADLPRKPRSQDADALTADFRARAG